MALTNKQEEAEKKVNAILAAARQADVASIKIPGSEVIVRLSYELYCEMLGFTKMIGGIPGEQRSFGGHPCEVYPGEHCDEKSYSIYIQTATHRFS